MKVSHFSIAFLLVLAFRFFFIATYQVKSSSMHPALKEGDHLLSINLKYIPINLKPNDVVIFYSESFSSLFIKRISKTYQSHYEVVSDNPSGLDSKTLGKIEKKNVKAYPFFIYYPFQDIRLINL